MEFILGLFIGMTFWNFVFIAIFLGIIVISEVNENLFLFLFGVVAWLVYSWWIDSSFYQSLTITGVILTILAYLGAGVIWSIVKWNNVADKIAMETKKYADKDTTEESLKSEIASNIRRDADTDKFIYWIANWPLSIVHHFFGVTIYEFFAKIAKYLSTIYDRISAQKVEKYGTISPSSPGTPTTSGGRKKT